MSSGTARLAGVASRVSTLWRRYQGENNETTLLALIFGLVLVMAVAEPSSLTLGFVADIVRSGIVTLALALGLLLIIISGGMDVSFTAIAIFSGYSTITLMGNLGIDGKIWPFLVSSVIGLVLGSLNALLVARYRMETLIATLGTQVIIRGILIAFIGGAYISVLPTQLDSVGQLTIMHMGASPVNVLVIPVLILAAILAWVLRRTTFGRSIYAIGGDRESARRVGIRVGSVQVRIYLVAGLLAGFAGMVHVVLSRHGSPFEIVGTELNVIAAVVIGGALDSGGRGSVRGTIFGVMLISLVQNSLVRLGISSYWHVFVVGLVVLVGVGIQAKSASRAAKMTRILEEAEVA